MTPALRSLLSLTLLVGGVRLAAADDAPPEVDPCRPAPADAQLDATFQPDLSLRELSLWLTGHTCKTVLFTPEVAQHATRINVIARRPVTPKQAVQLFVDAVEATGLAVVVKGDTIVVKPGRGMPARCPDLDPGPAPPPAMPPSPPPPPAPSAVDLDAGIRAVDPTHYVITRALVDQLLNNPMAISESARIVPVGTAGVLDGFKLYAVRATSVLGRLGLRSGDVIRTVNGFAVKTPEQALEVYPKLRSASALELGGTRAGKPLTIDIDIQ